jgi:hypothetical protein
MLYKSAILRVDGSRRGTLRPIGRSPAVMRSLTLCRFAPALALAAALGACAVAPPTEPSVVVLPAEGKSFATFEAEDGQCRKAATERVTEAREVAANRINGSLVLGTVFGASEGALLGFAVGDPAGGAALGAAAGLFFGTGAAANAGGYGVTQVQHAYDAVYLQCMASAGNVVPAQLAGGGYAYPLYGYPYPPPDYRY